MKNNSSDLYKDLKNMIWRGSNIRQKLYVFTEYLREELPALPGFAEYEAQDLDTYLSGIHEVINRSLKPVYTAIDALNKRGQL